MRTSAAIVMCLAITGCVADSADDAFEFGQSTPKPASGKADGPTSCGTDTCLPELCGYDCSVAGEQAKSACAATDGRATSFVTGSASGGSFDSRTNPYVPLLALDNVIVYGCELWDYSSGAYDGLAVQYEELIHSSFAVNASDPTRTQKDFALYIDHFAGPGSYRAQAQYAATSEGTRYAASDACSVDVTVDSSGTVNGAYNCTIKSQAGGSIGVTGTFGCAKNAMSPIFSKWAAAPH